MKKARDLPRISRYEAIPGARRHRFGYIDPQSGMLATPSCPNTRQEVYIAGTQPVTSCPLHGGSRPVTSVSGWQVSEPAQTPAGGDMAPHIRVPAPMDRCSRATCLAAPHARTARNGLPPVLLNLLPPRNQRRRRKRDSSGV